MAAKVAARVKKNLGNSDLLVGLSPSDPNESKESRNLNSENIILQVRLRSLSSFWYIIGLFVSQKHNQECSSLLSNCFFEEQ